ncbi:hypothetical protein HPB48_015202 [Haemaphysalis longicornis]|uniref:RING-type domain-containing protein n=1 Tax=Haemaphysalis longicornis TaxID=44386 RepID=A0A9J6FIT4_HAELO|nr:hypothetical protein HPB48_015202 [Haemaphysalis longicornis]
MDDQLLDVGPRELTETDFARLLLLLLSPDIDSLEDDLLEAGTRGLPEAEIGCLPSYPFNTEAHPEQLCVVCISQMESREIIRALPCRHKFHASCIDQWLRINRKCPLCRLDASVAGPSAFPNS